MAQDITYFEAGYIDETYFAYTADAVSTNPTQSTMTVAVGVIRNAGIAISASFTQTIQAVEQSLLELFAFSNALLTAQASRIRPGNVQLISSTVLSVQAIRAVYALSQEYAEFTMVTNNRRVRTNSAAANAAFSSGGAVVDGTREENITGSVVVTGPRTTATIIGNING